MLYYLILWNQVDILQKHFKKGSCPYAPLDAVLRYSGWGLREMRVVAKSVRLQRVKLLVVPENKRKFRVFSFRPIDSVVFLNIKNLLFLYLLTPFL